MTPPRLTAPSVLCVALSLTAALASCSGGDGADPSPSTTPAIVVADTPAMPTTVEALPTIDADGFEELLGELRGTPLVVNFWATWCEPCAREMPLLATAARQHRETIQFLGVDILDAKESARGFLRRFDVPYPNVFDATGATRDAVGSLGQPVTVFYGAEGEVVAKVDGELSPDALADHLAAIA